MMTKVNIDIQKEVNPNFESVWRTRQPYNVLKGGRNSFKSSVVALLLVYMMIAYIQRHDKANVVVIRKVANTLRDSVFLKIQWAIRKFDLSDEFKMTVSPFKIEHISTGSTFYFYGQDDFQKLKSNDIGNIIAVWYEEAAEFSNKEDFDQTNVTFMRQKHEHADFVKFFWSYNPPRNPYSWINEWAEGLKSEPNYLVHESSYLDDKLGFVTDQMLADIERIKENDYDYYRYIYLGEPVGLGTNVYNMNLFKPLNELPEDDYIAELYFAVDSGHQVSATTCGCYALTAKQNVILLETYYYSPAGRVVKKAPSELSKDLHTFVTNCERKYNKFAYKKTIDSAEGALRNQYYLDYNERWHCVAKAKKIDMIDHVQNLLAQGRFFYLNNDSNKIFVDEHKKYQWIEDTLNSDDPKVIKEDDHSVDAFQYFVKDNLVDLGLKW